MAAELENGKTLSPEQIAEAEKYKNEANEYFKSTYFTKNFNLTSFIKKEYIIFIHFPCLFRKSV